MAKIQNTETPSPEKDIEQQELIAGRNAKCKATLEDGLAVFYKAKHSLTL